MTILRPVTYILQCTREITHKLTVYRTKLYFYTPILLNIININLGEAKLRRIHMHWIHDVVSTSVLNISNLERDQLFSNCASSQAIFRYFNAQCKPQWILNKLISAYNPPSFADCISRDKSANGTDLSANEICRGSRARLRKPANKVLLRLRIESLRSHTWVSYLRGFELGKV